MRFLSIEQEEHIATNIVWLGRNVSFRSFGLNIFIHE